MVKKSKWWCIFIFAFTMVPHYGQQDTITLRFEEYLDYVKQYHPVVKQAQLGYAAGQAGVLKARGGFDPKVEVDYQKKEFKGTEYWDRLNTTFSIPTWYGIDIKGSFEQREGNYINPDETLPEDGLYSAGVSMSLGQGFWINERMATLKKAKYFQEQSLAEQDVQVNDVLYKASVAYFKWLKEYLDYKMYTDFLDNAEIRFKGVREVALLGDIAKIDTVEAKIAVRNRKLEMEQARLNLTKASLELSNFLWIEEVPVEVKPWVVPEQDVALKIDDALGIHQMQVDQFEAEAHPKMKSLYYKMKGLEVEKRLKANKLLPKLDVHYNFISSDFSGIQELDLDNYKGGFSFRVPLFLRKERGDLKLAKFYLSDIEFERDYTRVTLKNKITAVFREIESYTNQFQMISTITDEYALLLNAEERKFEVGESSLFLINSRESKLIDANLKKNELQNKLFQAKAELFKSMGVTNTTL